MSPAVAWLNVILAAWPGPGSCGNSLHVSVPQASAVGQSHLAVPVADGAAEGTTSWKAVITFVG